MTVCSLVLSWIAPRLHSSGSPGIRNSDTQGGVGCPTKSKLIKKKYLTGQANADTCPQMIPGWVKLTSHMDLTLEAIKWFYFSNL